MSLDDINRSLARAFSLDRPVDFGEHAVKEPQMTNLVFNTPASIDAFCEAEADRRAYRRGDAPEPFVAEPRTGETTAIRSGIGRKLRSIKQRLADIREARELEAFEAADTGVYTRQC